MATPIYSGPRKFSLGVWDEDETAPEALSEEEKQAQGEQVLQQLAATPPATETAPVPEEEPVAAYQRLSKEAEQAAPTERDVLAAGIRRAGAQMRAEAPAYLEKAAETLFYKPDYSQITRIAEGEAKQPDIILSAKEQAQKRLQGLAESARKRALLPAEMAEKEAKTLKTQEELRTLKQKGAPLPEERRKLYESMINSFISRNKLGDSIKLPESVTEEDANRLLTSSRSGDTTGWRNARLDFDRAEAERKQARFEQKEEEKQLEKGLTFDDKSFKGRTTKEAQQLRDNISSFNTIKGSLRDLNAQYSNITLENYKQTPKAVQEMNTIGKDLIMRIKNLYELGAPQTGELKFLYSLIGTSPDEVLKNILQDRTLGTSFPEKLKSIERIYRNGVQSAIDAKAVPGNSSKEAEKTTKPLAPTAPKNTKQQKLDEIDKKMKELEERLKSGE